MRPHQRRRIERLEQAVALKGRLFPIAFFWREGDGPIAELEAEFRADHGVGPHDELIKLIITYEPAPPASSSLNGSSS